MTCAYKYAFVLGLGARHGGIVELSEDSWVCDSVRVLYLLTYLVIQVEVEHAFFHCAKAYLRSQLWQPETWPAEAYHVRFGPYFHSSEARSEALDTAVNQQCRSLHRRPLRTGGRETTARLLFRLWAMHERHA